MTAIKERPILMSTPMVRALRARTKTNTRRVIKPQPIENEGMGCRRLTYFTKNGRESLNESFDPWPENALALDYCPYGKPGDQLWVREAMRILEIGLVYDADAFKVSNIPAGWENVTRRPHVTSMFMPRWASRITLEITEVRVERLQDISEADAIAEGIVSTEFWTPKELDKRPFEEKWWDDHHFWNHYPQMVYRRLWESIHGAGSWAANPFCWCLTFRVIG